VHRGWGVGTAVREAGSSPHGSFCFPGTQPWQPRLRPGAGGRGTCAAQQCRCPAACKPAPQRATARPPKKEGLVGRLAYAYESRRSCGPWTAHGLKTKSLAIFYRRHLPNLAGADSTACALPSNNLGLN
jgi:hypothetical protein